MSSVHHTGLSTFKAVDWFEPAQEENATE